MSTKYLDYSGLSYFWNKLKNYLATTSHSGLMSATDKAKVDSINTDGTIAYYRKEESVYVTKTANENTIPIGVSGFTAADMLLVDINGLDLSEGEEYEISGTNVVLDTPIGTIGTPVHFVVLRAVTATVSDYDALKGDDGVVQDVLQNGVSVLGQDGVARIVAETDVGTSTPTADTTAKFDNDVHMNSTDMTTGSGSELEDFIDGLNVSGGSPLLDMFYPVGSYYETSDDTFDPNVRWGGTWVRETAGLVHVSASIGAGTDYEVIGAPTDTQDGGSEYIQEHSHGFTNPTIDNASGTHNHTITVRYRTKALASGTAQSQPYANASSTSTAIAYTSSTGGHGHSYSANGSVNAVSGATAGQGDNMMPYINVVRWHRTA